jgi:hypothetical protein
MAVLMGEAGHKNNPETGYAQDPASRWPHLRRTIGAHGRDPDDGIRLNLTKQMLIPARPAQIGQTQPLVN